jgi:hypothetical protein
MVSASGDLRLLHLHRRTVFTFDWQDRMVHENDPDRSRGKRFSLAGCPEGNLAVIRDDVPHAAALELERLVDDEPPFWRSDTELALLSGSLAALGASGPVNDGLFGFLWVFPTTLHGDDGVEVVHSGTSAAERIVDRFTDVVPESLAARGFRTPADLWEPWCVALVEDHIASIAQTVRAGPGGAEVGVDTAAEHRGRGLAAATSAAWSRHPALDGRTLFYGTNRMNTSSRRVTDRLGLRLIALMFAIA